MAKTANEKNKSGHIQPHETIKYILLANYIVKMQFQLFFLKYFMHISSHKLRVCVWETLPLATACVFVIGIASCFPLACLLRQLPSTRASYSIFAGVWRHLAPTACNASYTNIGNNNKSNKR